MTIPNSYEALAADLASEKILSKTLLVQKEVYMILADERKVDLDAALDREASLDGHLDAALRQAKANWDYAQDKKQRLTVAEQRAYDMIHALTIADEYLCAAESLLDRGEDDSFNIEPAIIAVRDALKAALKPEEGEGS